ncbi:hypothetical protein ASA1KI_37610 [Opitutales bacterium ASA1]|nr:hypothetical protein ASA1KI_37610 [Opitutales bacterium ASA1]
MKHRLARAAFSACALLSLDAVRSFAQVMEDPVTVPVQIVALGAVMGQSPAPGYAWVTSAIGVNVGGYSKSASVSSYEQTVASKTFSLTAQLTPGKSYTMGLTCLNVRSAFQVAVAAPAGYRVFIDNVEQYGVSSVNA